MTYSPPWHPKDALSVCFSTNKQGALKASVRKTCRAGGVSEGPGVLVGRGRAVNVGVCVGSGEGVGVCVSVGSGEGVNVGVSVGSGEGVGVEVSGGFSVAVGE